ncbi:hypothetical protein [Devosia sp. LC5]|uniref:hypothetical protein n=1 Tax=Devosia sp. LC5 TaxID=1502724 RepID=UPI0013640857|nr:hypothetical protein [Devosia sp. LC5]
MGDVDNMLLHYAQLRCNIITVTSPRGTLFVDYETRRPAENCDQAAANLVLM